MMRKAQNILIDSAVMASIVASAYLYALFFYKIQNTSCLWDIGDSFNLMSWAILSTLVLVIPLTLILNMAFKRRRIPIAIEIAASFALAAYIPLRWFVEDEYMLYGLVAAAFAIGLVIGLFSWRFYKLKQPEDTHISTDITLLALGFCFLVHMDHVWNGAGIIIFFVMLAAAVLFVRLARLSKLTPILVLIAAAWGAFTLWQNTHPPTPHESERSDEKNLIIITIDALRADAIEPYNPSWKTPAFTRLANRSIVYERAYAASPWTMPSLASMLSGLKPRAHGCTEPERCLAPEVSSLAEVMQAEGFDTAAVLYQWLFTVPTGFERGFGRYSLTVCHPIALFHQYFAPISRLPEELLDGYPHLTVLTTIDALRTMKSLKQPFFLWVHYFDPHGRYAPPKRFLRNVKKPESEINLPGHSAGYPEWIDPTVLQKLAPESPPPKPYEIEYVREMYQAEVAFADEQIARFTEFMEASGLVSNTYLILSSDHGEEFYEHKGWDHGRTLYNEVLHIPLMISGPDITPDRTKCFATHPDIFNTSLKLFGIAPPFSQGQNLLAVPQQHCQDRELSACTAFVTRKESDAIYSWPYKLINPPLELYRIDEDPAEQNEIKAENIDLAIELKWKLQDMIATDYTIYKKLGIEPLPKDAKKIQEEVLKALGYIE